jgi:hypothetical protein
MDLLFSRMAFGSIIKNIQIFHVVTLIVQIFIYQIVDTYKKISNK